MSCSIKGFDKGESGGLISRGVVCAFEFDSETKKLRVLDQTLLPQVINYVDVPDSKRGYSVIKNMIVRGAPCIAAVGCLSIIAELNQTQFIHDSMRFTFNDTLVWLREKSAYLIKARPTAVNLRNALQKLDEYAEILCKEIVSKNNLDLVKRLTDFCLGSIEAGKVLNERLGDFGAEELLRTAKKHDGLVVLTHCNTGALATVGHGTALGIIRSLRNKGVLKHVYCTETRPCNQGSRLTAWELTREKIPATLITDSMVAYLMTTQKIDAVLVGADCVALNGDTANKIGTLQLAVTAKFYSVPFYVAAPTQSFDLGINDQTGIKIELRSSNELRRIDDVVLAPEEINVWNPCFDVTNTTLITKIITEFGVCLPDHIQEFFSKIDDMKDDYNLKALF